MSRLIECLVIGTVGLVVLAAAARPISQLIDALIPLVLVGGIVLAVLQCVRYLTRR
jgi:hypothetical protein